jgi:hypothetical protein
LLNLKEVFTENKHTVGVKNSEFNGVPFMSAFIGGFGLQTWAAVASPPDTKYNGSGIAGSPCYLAPVS